MNNKIVKEVFIIILLVIVIMFCLGILFYDSMPKGTYLISSNEYKTSSEVNEVLTEIQSNSGVDIKSQESNSLLKSYSINANDLNNFASDNSYESGKQDPFAEYSETVEEVVTTTTRGGQTSPSQTSNPVNSSKNEVSNTTENKVNTNSVDKLNSLKNTVSNKTVDKTESSSTTGTFFESKNSK